MRDKFWNVYIENYTSFFYHFEIPVNKNGFERSVLDFDLIFLASGDKYGLFKYVDGGIIDQYIQRRNVDFLTEEYNWISLLDIERFDDTRLGRMSILLPSEHGVLTPKPYHVPFMIDNCLCLTQGDSLYWPRLSELDNWDGIVSLSVSSSSSIWWENLDFSYTEDGDYLKFEPAMDNRFFSYRIVPRFNSFIRDVTLKVEALGGKVLIDSDSDKRYVREQGILLDGKIIYQEDIDEGRVKLPEF